jgi:hypothetical protein
MGSPDWVKTTGRFVSLPKFSDLRQHFLFIFQTECEVFPCEQFLPFICGRSVFIGYKVLTLTSFLHSTGAVLVNFSQPNIK